MQTSRICSVIEEREQAQEVNVVRWKIVVDSCLGYQLQVLQTTQVFLLPYLSFFFLPKTLRIFILVWRDCSVVRALADLLKDMGSIPSPYMEASNSSYRGFKTIF